MRLFVIALCALFLFGCASFGPGNIEYPYSLKDSGGRSVQNSKYEIEPTFSFQNINLRVKNKSEGAIKILLDSSSLITPDGRSIRLVSGRTQLGNASNVQPALVVPRGVEVNEVVTSSVFTNMGGGVIIGDFLMPSNQAAKDFIGKEFILLLTIEDHRGKRSEENMVFKIDGPAPTRTTSSVGPGR